MVNGVYQLKRSLLALVFQLIILMGLSFIWLQLFPLYICLSFMTTAFIVYLFFLKRRQIIALAQLDGQDWSIMWSDETQSRAILKKVQDHYFYIVLSFEPSKISSIVWCDQISHEHWRQFKVMAKLL